MKRGDRVMIRRGAETKRAVVLLASGNARSLMLGFDGTIGKHAGAMPVLMGQDGVYRSLVTDEAVRISWLEQIDD